MRVLIVSFLSFILGFVLSQNNIKNNNQFTFSNVFDYTISYYGLKYSGTSGSFVDNSVLFYGAYEKPEINFLIDLVKNLDSNNVIFLDIGANSGLHSLALSNLVKEVHAIEPYPPILEKLKYNISQNHLNNIFVHAVGFGQESGSLPFFSPPSINTAIGTFSKDFADNWNSKSKVTESSKEISLPIVNGDEYLTNKSISKIDIIKLDIEGYEKFALLGLKKIINNNRPIIVMELNMNNKEGFQDIEELFSILPKDYSGFEFNNKVEDLYTGNYLLTKLKVNNSDQRNIVLYPKEKENNVSIKSK